VIGMLHNMSVPPRTVISYQAPRAASTLSRRVRFVVRTDPADPLAILQILEPDYAGQDPAHDLRDRIKRCALGLCLPAAAPVVAGGAADTTSESLLDACTVLAKSSGAVYLRDKELNLDRVRSGAAVTLLIPANWRADK